MCSNRILDKTSTTIQFTMADQGNVTATKRYGICHYMHKNNKLEKHIFMIKLLHPGYYILNDAFHEKH